ncbi:uncharacterized protein LOC106180471 [Lingula anatina]|uniref:Uncharacterized protein LOC106180471 n=1 Tax=Lingula anatina TaxID=7574 RepID=A0A1S3KBP2_LINAN|nr:uncharacterized protein LOC106180471 [Lingula anatina]|eukprot:XP_013419912.1 uncharacterized protein LOC106180471 [Lingula anatina]
MVTRVMLLPLILAALGLQAVDGETVTFLGHISRNKDDYPSFVSCPTGYFGIRCACSNDSDVCDGAYFDSNGGCTAFNTLNKPGIRAQVTCESLGSVINTVSVASTSKGWSNNPVASCPSGSHLIDCNFHYPWIQFETNRIFNINSDAQNGQCSLDRTCAHGGGCRVYAFCIFFA